MKTFPNPLTPAKERECLERLKDGDQEARRLLIEHNMRLVAHVVKKYQYTDYDTEDLLSVGTIGLIKAVSTFKPDRGSKLATYAAKCVENGDSVERLNGLLHDYGEFIIGRMGIPYRQKKINILSIALDAPQDTISALAGKLGNLKGVSVKTAYSHVTGQET